MNKPTKEEMLHCFDCYIREEACNNACIMTLKDCNRTVDAIRALIEKHGDGGPDCLVAFIQGAKWWEFYKTGGTMWQSDQDLTETEAKSRLVSGTLGISLSNVFHRKCGK